MTITSRVPALPLGTPFFALAIATSGWAIGHVRYLGHRPVVAVIEIGLVIAIALGFVHTGRWLTTTDLREGAVWRVFVGTTVFGMIAVTIAAILVALQHVRGDPVTDASFVLFLAWTMGAAFGTPTTYLFELSRYRSAQLRESGERAGSLARRLSISQRILRHDLRNDLNVILGAVDDLGHGEQEDWARDTIEAAADRLLAAAEESIALQQIVEEEGRTRFDFLALIDEILEDLEDRGHDPTIELSGPSSCAVVAHPHLPEAIRELVRNAVEHNDDADLVVTLTIECPADDGGRCRLTIEDNGRGLPAEERLAIEGEPETQLDHASGVGLWLVRTVIDQSGGGMRYMDVEPSGARFQIDLPRG